MSSWNPHTPLNAYDPPEQALARLNPFLETFEARARMVVAHVGERVEPLRLVWVGSSSRMWACVAMREPDFDAAILRMCQSSEPTSFPWAHGPQMLGQLAQRALALSPTIRAAHLGSHPLGPSLGPHWRQESSFSAPRTRNFTRYFATPKTDVAESAALLLRELPGSWIYTADGVPLDLEPAPGPAAMAPLSLPEQLDHFHHGAGAAPHPQTQVDGDGTPFILWLPAAARALGAPQALSTSLIGIQYLLGLGDILGAANRMAQETPALFRARMAEAIIAFDPTRSIPIQMAESHDGFVARDRRSLIAQAAPAPPRDSSELSSKGPRL